MDRLALNRAVDELADERLALRAEVGLAVAGSVLAVVAAAAAPRLVAAAAAGAASAAALALLAFLRRRELIARLATDRDAYEVDEVRRYGLRLAGTKARTRLAAALRQLPTDPVTGGWLVPPERIAAVETQIAALAAELGSPTAVVAPECAVTCRRLLTDPVESPLLNPTLPLEDLRATLLRIRAGVREPEPDGEAPQLVPAAG